MSQLDKKSPAGAYAWCSECLWKDTTDKCEANGRRHSDALQHIVHVYEPEGAES